MVRADPLGGGAEALADYGHARVPPREPPVHPVVRNAVGDDRGDDVVGEPQEGVDGGGPMVCRWDGLGLFPVAHCGNLLRHDVSFLGGVSIGHDESPKTKQWSPMCSNVI